jgi:hypothetical protein
LPADMLAFAMWLPIKPVSPVISTLFTASTPY